MMHWVFPQQRLQQSPLPNGMNSKLRKDQAPEVHVPADTRTHCRAIWVTLSHSGGFMALVGHKQICILLGSDWFCGHHRDMDTIFSSVSGSVV